MADKKISELTEKTVPVSNDLLLLVDSESTPISSKKIKWSNIAKGRTATYVVAASNAPANVKAQADYVCDGVDDQVEIQAAIDALRGIWGCIYLTDGLYKISDTIILYSGIGLKANMPSWGTYGSVTVGAMLYTSQNKAILKIVQDPSHLGCSWFPYVENVMFCGSGNGAYTSQHGIYVSLDNGTINDVYLNNVMVLNMGGKGIYVNNGGKIWIDKGYVEDCQGDGIYMRSSGGFYITGMYIYKNGLTAGSNIWVVETGFGGLISNNQIRQDADTGVVADIRINDAGTGCIISGNYFYGNGTSAKPCIYLSAGNNIKNYSITSNGFYNYINCIQIAKGTGWVDDIPNAVIVANTFMSVTNMVYSTDWNVNAISVQVENNVGYIAPGEVRTASGSLTKTDYTFTTVTGTFTETGTQLKPGVNTLHCTADGTAKIDIPAGCVAIAASVGGGATVADSPKTLVNNTAFAVTAGGTNEFTITITHIAFAWHNPEAQDILIKKVVLNITTKGGTATSTMDVGIADNATGTNLGAEFFNDIDVDSTAAIHDSYVAGGGGTQTLWIGCQDSASATDGWIVGQIITEKADGLVGSYYIEYIGK